MSRIFYINGRYMPAAHAAIHAEDRANLFGDAVYEVFTVLEGKLLDRRAHFDRLIRSLNEMKMNGTPPEPHLVIIMKELLRRNHLKNAYLYIQISRGTAPRDFKFPKAGTPPTIFIMARPFSVQNNPSLHNGIRVMTVEDIRWARRDIKTIQLLGQSMAKQEAVDNGYDDAWMIGPDGMVNEGSASNAYIVKDKTIQTRPVTTSILKGCTRNAIEALCQEGGYKFLEKPFTVEEAYKADEAFVTGATTLVTPIIQLNNKEIGTGQPGPVAKRLLELYLDYATDPAQDGFAWQSGLS